MPGSFHRVVVLIGLLLASGVQASETRAPPKPTTRDACIAAGGDWDDLSGRGHITGCNLPTSDGGKACTDSGQCEGVCRNGRCTDHQQARGCGILENGRRLCID